MLIAHTEKEGFTRVQSSCASRDDSTAVAMPRTACGQTATSPRNDLVVMMTGFTVFIQHVYGSLWH